VNSLLGTLRRAGDDWANSHFSNWGIVLNIRNVLSSSIVSFCSLLLLTSSATAQTPCTPVVYAFRHAEDESTAVPPYACFPGSSVHCTTKLKPTGTEHANLYVEMITSFEGIKNYCPVATVYSVNPVLPTGGGGTNNPFYTARPLANTVMNADPIITIGGMNLDEFLTKVLPPTLLDELKNKMTSGSAAVFWTSDGLHDLGKAIVPGFEGIPVKNKAEGVPPRNAAYVFEYDAENGVFDPPSVPPSNSTQYVQCFNFASFRAAGSVSSTKYYCGKALPAGSISGSIGDASLYKLHGRICDTLCTSVSDTCPSPLKTVTESPANYYGYCESPPAGSPP
jgi:hypothetical protein